MASQWGRDSGFQSGRKRGGPALTVIVVLLALLFGVAGGYAAFRFGQPSTGAAADAVELNAALDAAGKELSEARAREASSAALVEELRADIARQAAELDALSEKLAANTSAPQQSPDDTTAVDALTGERDRLAQENQTLKTKLAALEAEREALAQDASLTEKRLAADLARLQDEVVPDLTAERDRLQRKTLMMLADQTDLKARIETATEAQASATQRIAELEARLADAEDELSASREVLDALKLEARAAEVAKTVAAGQGAETTTEQTAPENPTPDSREPEAVAQALRTTPGLETLSEADRQSLTDMLVAGKCVTTALKSVFERVPILTLRNLIRDLNSDC